MYLFDEYILLKWIVYSDAKSRNVYSGSIPLPSEKGINVGAEWIHNEVLYKSNRQKNKQFDETKYKCLKLDSVDKNKKSSGFELMIYFSQAQYLNHLVMMMHNQIN